MKTKLTFLFTIFITGVVTILYAGPFVPYNVAKAPALPLPNAYEKAMTALSSATNQFHCLSANIQTSFSPDGEWFFTFYSTNSTPKRKWVTVEFNGKVHIEDILVR